MALLVAFFVVLAILPQARQWDQEPTGEAAESQPVSAVQTELADTKQEAARFTVCLDPGHGGNDSGCVSGKRHESDDALMMAKLIKKYLEQENVQVVLTRTKDKYVELSERAQCANQANADYFVSIHRNLNPLGCGVETWTRADYSKESNKTVGSSTAPRKTPPPATMSCARPRCPACSSSWGSSTTRRTTSCWTSTRKPMPKPSPRGSFRPRRSTTAKAKKVRQTRQNPSKMPKLLFSTGQELLPIRPAPACVA